MDDEERQKLVEKMDKDLQQFVKERTEACKQSKADNPTPEQSVDEIYEELKNHPAFMTEWDPTKEMSPEMAGLQAMKYETDSSDFNAESYKDEGNHNFKLKKYRWAIASYAAGIKERPISKELNAVLYSNRAAAQSHLENYRSAFNDVIFARRFKPDHMKAIIRGIQCCLKLQAYSDAIKWCDDGLLLNSTDSKVLEFRNQAEKYKKQQERDKRREQAKDRKEQKKEEILLAAIQDHGVTLGPAKSKLASIESHHPSGSKVHLDDNGTLYWPVMFVYPEYAQTDFIESFSEQSTLSDHLEAMFGFHVSPAPWDEDRKYKADLIDIYFEDGEKEKLYQVEKNASLQKTLKHKRYVVCGGTPSFIIVVKGSAYAKHMLSKYKS